MRILTTYLYNQISFTFQKTLPLRKFSLQPSDTRSLVLQNEILFQGQEKNQLSWSVFQNISGTEQYSDNLYD